MSEAPSPDLPQLSSLTALRPQSQEAAAATVSADQETEIAKGSTNPADRQSKPGVVTVPAAARLVIPYKPNIASTIMQPMGTISVPFYCVAESRPVLVAIAANTAA